MIKRDAVALALARSLIVLLLVGGSLSLAAVDPNDRPFLADLSKIGLGGDLGQLVPRNRD